MTDFVPDPPPKPRETAVSKFLRALADDIDEAGQPVPCLQSLNASYSDCGGNSIAFEIWIGKAKLLRAAAAGREALHKL